MINYIFKAILAFVFLLFSFEVSAQVEIVASNSGNAFSVNYPANFGGYITKGITITFKALQTITGPATLSLNGIAAKPIKKQATVDLAANDIVSGQYVTVSFDGTNFQMTSLTGTLGVAGTANQTLYHDGTEWKAKANLYNNGSAIGISGTGATAPDVSALLDIDASKKGILIPRVALTSGTDAVTILTPATSLLVYNTGAGGLAPAGYYYNSGTSGSPVWVRFLTALSGTRWDQIEAPTANLALAHTTYTTAFTFNGVNMGTAFDMSSNTLTTGNLLSLSSSNAAATGNVFSATSNSTGAEVNGIARFNFTGAHSNNGLQIDDATATGTVAKITANALTTGTGLYVSSTNAAATGNAFITESNSIGAAANGIARFNFSGAHTGSGLQIDDATATGTTAKITANALTTGTGLYVSSTNAAATGNTFITESNSTGAAANGIARFNFSGAHTGNGLQIDDATTSGNAAAISANNLSSGSALSLYSTSTAGSASKLLNIARSGDNTTWGAINYGIYTTLSGAGANSKNVAAFLSATNGIAANYALLVPSGGGSVGIGTTSPNTLLDVNGSFALRDTNLVLSNGANNNIIIGTKSFYRITGPNAAFSISGLTAGVDGRIVTLYNNTTVPMSTINNLTSTPVNQILTITGSDLVPNTGPNIIQLQYNATMQRWLVIGGQNLSVTGGGNLFLTRGY